MNRFRCIVSWIAFLAIVSFVSRSNLRGQEKGILPVHELSSAVFVQAGDLPIIVSAPHGGALGVDGVYERKGEGLTTGPSGFFTGRDTATEELAMEVSTAIALARSRIRLYRESIESISIPIVHPRSPSRIPASNPSMIATTIRSKVTATK